MDTNEPDDSRPGNDPLAELAGAWISMWDLWSRQQGFGTRRPPAGWETLFWPWASMWCPWLGPDFDGRSPSAPPCEPGDPRDPPPDRPENPFQAWAEIYAPWLAQRSFKTPPTEPPSGGEATMQGVAKAYTRALSSYFRYLSRTAHTSGRYYRTVAGNIDRMASDPSERPAEFGDLDDLDAMRAMLDESMAHFREFGEVSVREARILQKHLLEIAGELRQQATERRPNPKRAAKAKP